MAAKRPQILTPSASPPGQVTVEIVYVDTLPPQQEAAWEWFVQQVHARLARRRQQQQREAADTPERSPENP